MSLIIEKYSEKALIVKGDTKTYRTHIKNLGGSWNSSLGGWIFPLTKKHELERLNGLIKEGKVEPTPELPDGRNYVSVREYLSLLSRVERLEQILATYPQGSLRIPSKPLSVLEPISDEEDEKELAPPRLLRRK